MSGILIAEAGLPMPAAGTHHCQLGPARAGFLSYINGDTGLCAVAAAGRLRMQFYVILTLLIIYARAQCILDTLHALTPLLPLAHAAARSGVWRTPRGLPQAESRLGERWRRGRPTRRARSWLFGSDCSVGIRVAN